MKEKDYPVYDALLYQILRGWESLNGNPDAYIYQRYDGNYELLAYSYDKNYERGSFSCHEIESDEDGCYVCIGTIRSLLTLDKAAGCLNIGSWGSYMKN